MAILNDALLNKAKVDEGKTELLEMLGQAEEEMRQLRGPIGHRLEDGQAMVQATQVCKNCLLKFIRCLSFSNVHLMN